MPSEYTELVDALQLTGIPFAEYGWRKRPAGIYGVVALDEEAGHLDGDDEKLDRTWSASVDVFCPMLADRDSVIPLIEGVLNSVCGSAWELNSVQHETETGLFHYEWVCELTDDPE